MSFPRRNSYFGQTIDEYIAAGAHAIASERAVWKIVFDGHNGFGLKGKRY